MATAKQRVVAQRRIRLAQRRIPGDGTDESTRPRRKRKPWSADAADVAPRGNALHLAPGVFAQANPAKIAASLKRSAEASTTRRSTPFHSAMSMLNLYINRTGNELPPERRVVLEEAKRELRKAFGRLP